MSKSPREAQRARNAPERREPDERGYDNVVAWRPRRRPKPSGGPPPHAA